MMSPAGRLYLIPITPKDLTPNTTAGLGFNPLNASQGGCILIHGTWRTLPAISHTSSPLPASRLPGCTLPSTPPWPAVTKSHRLGGPDSRNLFILSWSRVGSWRSRDLCHGLVPKATQTWGTPLKPEREDGVWGAVLSLVPVEGSV
jgi:hypothetical protein